MITRSSDRMEIVKTISMKKRVQVYLVKIKQYFRCENKQIKDNNEIKNDDKSVEDNLLTCNLLWYLR